MTLISKPDTETITKLETNILDATFLSKILANWIQHHIRGIIHCDP